MTSATSAADGDGDGTDDQYQVFGFADSNGNGVEDRSEGICDLLDANSNGIVGLESEEGNVHCYRSISSNDLPTPPSSDKQFPFGLFSFRIDGLRVDTVQPARVALRVHLPQRPTGDVRWYKVDPATGSISRCLAPLRSTQHVR